MPSVGCLYFKCLESSKKMKPKDDMMLSTSFLYFLMFIVEKSIGAVVKPDGLGDG